MCASSKCNYRFKRIEGQHEIPATFCSWASFPATLVACTSTRGALSSTLLLQTCARSEGRQAPRAPASPLSPEKRPLGVSDALASATCGVFVPPFRVSDAGCQRQYGGQALYFFFQSCYRPCLVNTDDRAAPLSKCAT